MLEEFYKNPRYSHAIILLQLSLEGVLYVNKQLFFFFEVQNNFVSFLS